MTDHLPKKELLRTENLVTPIIDTKYLKDKKRGCLTETTSQKRLWPNL